MLLKMVQVIAKVVSNRKEDMQMWLTGLKSNWYPLGELIQFRCYFGLSRCNSQQTIVMLLL